ncbi:NADH:flavin oxidoreductase/NADH oxidase [Acinetobacter chinensis]|jgi:2,4-dienoyl-CoA reductase-like NADH-dependent reductase (Old Yellow Enzyme family)|uniref:NADH:flavin oxidoreductase/NADH oxidase n=1 Tax=Acinetobacter chinensis TaxID=2004650 RepID=UPI0029349F45|nr:NADH:flavin oxidoreductase/NADH oxidase [Acinetobacter chinensis]WOE41008.1 NADH:flavin oxidoreductase/NADH oxidase [Acinetobacter chinensis]
MARLFQPLQLGTLKLSNRIIIAPMCQYSATEQGQISYWHEQQWGTYALSGAGLCIVEATAVQPEGRISYADLGLWNDEQGERIAVLLKKIKTVSPMPFAIQLAHAGRKASTEKPWNVSHGKAQIASADAHGWQTVAPAELAFQESDEKPHALTVVELKTIQQDFAQAAKRAVEVGFDLIELHAAHGYLMHQFMSPLANTRTDEYGGSFENRIRMVMETFESIKKAVPENFPVGIRLSAQDWVEGGWTLEETVALSKQLEQAGAVYIHVSSGGLHPQQKIDVHASYQVPFAAQVKENVSIPVIAVGLVTESMQAEGILEYEQADAVGLARAMLYDPRWPWHAAAELGETIQIAPQYLRCQPHGFRDLFHPFDENS